MIRIFLAACLLAAGIGGASAQNTATAIFAGGCFWCVEADFDKVPGVISTTSGYIGGTVKNPTYQQVSGGNTGHAEAVEIAYDPAKVTYAQLLNVFWRNIDPLVKDKQFCDTGDQYRTAIFYRTNEEKKLAEVVDRITDVRHRLRIAVDHLERELLAVVGGGGASERQREDQRAGDPD